MVRTVLGVVAVAGGIVLAAVAAHTTGDAAMLASAMQVSPIRWPAASTHWSPV